MSLFDDMMEDVDTMLAHTHAREVTFRAAPGEDALAVKAIVHDEMTITGNQYDGRGARRERDLQVFFGNGIDAEDLSRESVFTIDGEQWDVRDITDRDANHALCRLARYRRDEASHEDHRVDRYA